MLSTPGIAPIDSSRRVHRNPGSGPVCIDCGRAPPARYGHPTVRTPRSTRITSTRLFRNSPAEISSRSESAICPVTSTFRKRPAAPLEDTEPASSFNNAVARSCLVAWKRKETRRIRRPVSTAVDEREHEGTGMKGQASESCERREAGRRSANATSRRKRPAPASPPAIASRTDSVSNWRISCARWAPTTASRMEISLPRPTAVLPAEDWRCWRMRSRVRTRWWRAGWSSARRPFSAPRSAPCAGLQRHHLRDELLPVAVAVPFCNGKSTS